LLYTSDVAYVFGEPPARDRGAHVYPGRVVSTANGQGIRARATGVQQGFSAPRMRTAAPDASESCNTVRWLVKWFGRASVLDPFAG
jgi:hypothetical protein